MIDDGRYDHLHGDEDDFIELPEYDEDYNIEDEF